jgi:hypothetical protein
MIMSSPHSKPITFGGPFSPPDTPFAAFDGSLPFSQSADRAIDAALKSVPLPDGLLNRLGLMVSTMSDEVSDRVDYLGC